MSRAMIVLVSALLTLGGAVLGAPVARADGRVTVGLFVPSAPFPSTAARVELANRLGAHLGAALEGTGAGRNYARAGDFSAAARKGDINVALVDAPYLASAGAGYTVIGAAVRGGETTHRWQLVARASTIAELRGKRVLVPGLGGRETDFVLNVLLAGDLGRGHFGKIAAAPDTASALAALGLGKADAAVVPVGVTLPAGTRVVLALPALPGPVLVAYGSLNAQQRKLLAAAAATFQGDATVSGFRAGDVDAVRAVARRFSVPVKRGPHAVPAVRLVVGELVEGRKITIERTPAASFAIGPAAR